jgi:hypothetical protein
MARTRSADTSAQPLEARNGLDAIARVERAICGDALTREQAVAEGLALAGTRAASLVPGSAASAPGGAELPGASCVHHLTAPAGERCVGGFELAAESLQQAIDHSLVAHILSLRLGRAGSCSLDASIAERLGLVRLPTPEIIHALLELDPGEAEPRASAERIVELARSAFQTVSRFTARPAHLVDVAGEPAAEVALVATGAEAVLVREVAHGLRESGVAAAVVCPALVRPFPADVVLEALRGVRIVFAVGAAARHETLLACVRRAADRKAEVHAFSEVGGDALLERVLDCLPDADSCWCLPVPGATRPPAAWPLRSRTSARSQSDRARSGGRARRSSHGNRRRCPTTVATSSWPPIRASWKPAAASPWSVRAARW